jgi:hypothetical protein
MYKFIAVTVFLLGINCVQSFASTSDRITKNDFIQLNRTSNIGSGCSPDGLHARSPADTSLTCVKGLWKSASIPNSSVDHSGIVTSVVIPTVTENNLGATCDNICYGQKIRVIKVKFVPEHNDSLINSIKLLKKQRYLLQGDGVDLTTNNITRIPDELTITPPYNDQSRSVNTVLLKALNHSGIATIETEGVQESIIGEQAPYQSDSEGPNGKSLFSYNVYAMHVDKTGAVMKINFALDEEGSKTEVLNDTLFISQYSSPLFIIKRKNDFILLLVQVEFYQKNDFFGIPMLPRTQPGAREKKW